MNDSKRTDLFFTLVALLTFAGAVVQTILLLVSYDPQQALYERGTPSYLVTAAILIILCLSFLFSCTLPGGKLRIPQKPTAENPDDDPDDDPAVRSVDLGTILQKIGALLLLIGAVLSGILLFYGAFPADHARELWLGASNGSTESSVRMAGKLLQFSAYAGILAAIFSALLLISGRSSPLLALTAVIWLLFLDLSVYFDNGSVLNDPCRSLEILGLSTAILWLVCEIKRLLGGAGRRGYAFLSLSAFGILCICTIPRLIATAAGRLDFTSRTLVLVAMLGIAIMIAGRLERLRHTPPEPEAQEDSEQPPAKTPEKEEILLKKEIEPEICAPDADLRGLPDGSEETEDLADDALDPRKSDPDDPTFAPESAQPSEEEIRPEHGDDAP